MKRQSMPKIGLLLVAGLLITREAFASFENLANQKDYLVKMSDATAIEMLQMQLQTEGVKAESLTEQWIRVEPPKSRRARTLSILQNNSEIEYIQPNYPIRLFDGYSPQDALRRRALEKSLNRLNGRTNPVDNPPIPAAPQTSTGVADPLFAKQWGMIDIGVQEAWKVTLGDPNLIVAVIDTGVDYTHEDLLPNLWRNTAEIADNGIDDDGNGYVDDLVGWDFIGNDNKPYDLKGSANPGHGTHCAGNVAGRGFNGTGIAGVAPNVKIMSLRFLGEKGGGTTADAIKAIKYAVDNGARILSNSWGSEGENPEEGAQNQALRDIIIYSQNKGVLFVAAAGNGHNGVGYNNDTDKDPAYPASYDMDNIVSVAALNNKDKLGSFSNWGAKSVDIGAPGVAVFSTTVGNTYSATVYPNLPFLTWDGTSMATPHVAGAAALYWSANPTKTWKDVKEALIATARKIPVLKGKAVSEGKLNVSDLMKYAK
jgi:thermitase